LKLNLTLKYPGFLEVLVAIPLILKNARPMAVNHFRIGGVIFFKDLFTGETFRDA
jgi:hypothetical protein